MGQHTNGYGSLSLYVQVILLMFPTLILGYEFRFNKYHQSPSPRKIQSGYILKSRTALSSDECKVQCGIVDGCVSASFEALSSNCVLSYVPFIELPLFSEYDTSWETYSTDDWLLVFRAPKGIGGDVYQSFVTGVGVTTEYFDCFDLTTPACQSNYRHTLLNSWGVANITKVRFSYYKGQAEVAFTEFDATGSDLMSWFRKERILDSTWPTSATDTYNIFSVEGHTGARHFYMSLRFNGCPGDRMYSLVLVSNTNSCYYDVQTTYPQFMYASTATEASPESGAGMDFADFIAIFVK